jgi:serine/threonine protein kinase
LPKDGPDRLAVLYELVKVDIERRRQLGELARAEDYLERYPELASCPQAAPANETPLATTPPANPTAVPHHIGRYRVEKVLGQGGFGIVYLAHDDELQRPVAIKVPHPHLVVRLEDVGTYLTEARTAALLDHPNIVPVHDIGATPDYPFFIVSKFIEGSTLAERLKQNPPTVVEVAKIVATVAQTLHYAHKKGVVHRDVKPGNILLELRPNGGRRPEIPTPAVPYVADFGLALRDTDAVRGAAIAGTPAYMSPEQGAGRGPSRGWPQ